MKTKYSFEVLDEIEGLTGDEIKELMKEYLTTVYLYLYNIRMKEFKSVFPGTKGLTLRDYFAGQAVAGLFSLPTVSPEDGLKIAKICYAVSDAMLAEREERNGKDNG